MSFPPLSPLTEKLFDPPDYAQRADNICSMVNFFPEARRLMDAIGIERIVEIGSEEGLNTAVLLDYVKSRKKKLITVDPAEVPFPFTPSGEPAFSFHQETSAEFLQRNIPAEVIFMDGDHNYETVLADLKTIHETRRKSGIKVLFLHDVSWPWARQDIYYDPARVSHPHPYHAENRVSPYADVKAASLSPANYMTADYAGGAENGVLTAVEDFLKLYGTSWRFQRIPVLYGIGILIAMENITEEEKRKLLPLVDELVSHCELLSILELNRIENLCLCDTLRQELDHAGNVWRNDQSYIQSVNEILPGLSDKIKTTETEIERLRQSLAEKEILLHDEQVKGAEQSKEWDAQKNKLESELHADMLRLQVAACEETRLRNNLEELRVALQKESETAAQRQADLNAVREELADREEKISTLTEQKNQDEIELSAKAQEIRRLQEDIQKCRQLSEEQQNRISMLQDLDRQNRIHQHTLEQDLRRQQLELPAEKWRTCQSFCQAVLPYSLRNRQKLRRIKRALTDGSVKLLSLDVFDTLLFREFRSEYGRFSDMGKILHQRYPNVTAKQFYYARSLAHYLAYRVCSVTEGCREPSMEEIFRIMVKILSLPEEMIPELMEVELQYELGHLHLNGTVWDLVLLARDRNIPVIAASDMYWGKDALQRIFADRLPDPDAVVKIYSSSDYGVSKAAGLLFERIAGEQKVDFSQIMHIGDNRQSDFDVPFVRHGLSAYWLPRSKFYTGFCSRQQKREKMKLQERNIIHGV